MTRRLILAAHYRRLGNGQHSETPRGDWPLNPFTERNPA